MRKRINTFAEVEKGIVHDKQESNHQIRDEDHSSNEHDTEEKPEHPYLGRKVDYSR